MRKYLYKLYQIIAGPLHRRLHRELSLELQTISQAHLDRNERISQKLLDEVLRLSVKLDEVTQRETTSPQAIPSTLSNSEIARIIGDLETSMGAVEACREHQLPISTILSIKAKYQGMNLATVRRTRQLEEQYALLSDQLKELKQENQKLKSLVK